VTVKGDVPPDQVTVTVTVVDWPDSRTVGEITMRTLLGGGFTVKWTVEVGMAAGVEALSFTTAQ
jgi:hypothetical protein